MDPAHALYVLLDSNLPTGGFVASGGLESYAKHGFLAPESDTPYSFVGETPALDEDLAKIKVKLEAATDTTTTTTTTTSNKTTNSHPSSWNARSQGTRPQSAPPLGPSRAGPAIMRFVRAELDNFEASTGDYLVRSWEAVRALLRGGSEGLGGVNSNQVDGVNGVNGTNGVDGVNESKTENPSRAPTIESTLATLLSLDRAHESTLLSHVARRASKAQGVALLTLYARGMVPPPGFETVGTVGTVGTDVGTDENGTGLDEDAVESHTDRVDGIIAAYRHAIRLGAPGHMAVCFGVVAACCGLDLKTTRHLYLFTHARSTLSAAVRLNIVGPYLSTQLLSHPVRSELADVLARERGGLEERERERERAEREREERARTKQDLEMETEMEDKSTEEDAWAWADEAERGAATTWPLGEILAARHDLQHSRIFNS